MQSALSNVHSFSWSDYGLSFFSMHFNEKKTDEWNISIKMKGKLFFSHLFHIYFMCVECVINLCENNDKGKEKFRNKFLPKWRDRFYYLISHLKDWRKIQNDFIKSDKKCVSFSHFYPKHTMKLSIIYVNVSFLENFLPTNSISREKIVSHEETFFSMKSILKRENMGKTTMEARG